MDITLQLINEIALPDVVARGRASFHEGRVHLETVSGDFVRATVDGSDIYTVELHQDDSGFDAVCNCPFQFEGKCKHVVATMLATLYDIAKVNVPVSARRGGPLERKTSWVDDMRTLLVPAEHQGSSSAEPPWRFAYSLKVTEKRRSITPVKIRMTKDGGDGQAIPLRKFDIHSDPHFDFLDRVVLERIGTEFTSGIPEKFNESMDDEEVNAWSAQDRLMGDVLNLLVNKEVYLAHQNNYAFRRAYISAEAARMSIGVNEYADGSIALQPQLEWQGTVFSLPIDTTLMCVDSLWILFDNTLARLSNVPVSDFFVLRRIDKEVLVPQRDRSEFLEEVLPRLVRRYKVRSNLSEIKTIDAIPKPRIYFSEVNDRLTLELRFLYGDVEVEELLLSEMEMKDEILPYEGGFVHVHRHQEIEHSVSKRLTELQLRSYVRTDGKRNYVPSETHPLEWLLTKLPVLLSEGIEVFGQNTLKHHRLRTERAKIGVRVSSGIDWFDMSVDVKFGGTAIGYKEFVEAVQRHEKFVKLDDGTFGVLPEQWLQRFRRALALGQPQKENLKFSRGHIGLLNDIAEGVDEFDSDDRFEAMRERMQAFTSIKTVPLPKGFHGELRPYQTAGYDWLHFLREFGLGGILADDMGLGKTVQTLALLQSVYEKGAALPSLIVVPTSPLFNWEKEIQRFTPELDVMVYAGADRRELQKEFGRHQIILTSYGILRRDIDDLKQHEFLYVVLDESQNIKNAVSVNAHSARALNAKHRLALSGTPVENNLMELWSQFAFVTPGMLGSERTFAENYAKPIERFGDEETSRALKQLIFPFILRRTKELVATELPPKVESTVYCDMDAEQMQAYEYWRQYYRESILKSIATIGLQKSKIKVLEGLMRLRQVCCHPRLVDSNYTGTAGKFDAMIEMLDDILAEGHKVLVFSQFVKMLEIVRRHCDNEKIVYEYLDGSTTNRRERVERFQTDEDVKLFLISLKAGGTGLNLTAADYVIHYDPWWNPAVEMQATDRTHRIGQKKQVFSYRLITRDSVEEKILALQEKKRTLVKSIITTDSGFMKSLTKQDVESLFM